jgi:dGTPase
MNKQYPQLKADQNYCKRYYSEEEDPLRSKFARDRDRLLFSKEFRRLEGKTQVFVSGFDDLTRNRLTHTLEVAQISKTISEEFNFNTTLCEAISYGHDVGHTPFGHIGERMLNFFTNNCDGFKDFQTFNINNMGFKHNWQGLKVTTILENISPQYPGLNLTDYTLWGILHHSNLEYKECKYNHENKCFYQHNTLNCHIPNNKFSLHYYNNFEKYYNLDSWTFEGLLVGISDEIAQRHHDIEDGLIANIIDRKDLVSKFRELFIDFIEDSDNQKLSTIEKSNSLNLILHDLSSLILKMYSINLIKNSEYQIDNLINKYKINNSNDFQSAKFEISKNENIFDFINFESKFIEQDKLFKSYLINHILNSHLAQSMDGKASFLIKSLITSFLTNPNQLPDKTIVSFFKDYLPVDEFNNIRNCKSDRILTGYFRGELNDLHNSTDDGKYSDTLMRTITDFIAGMTDKFAINQYKLLFEPDKYRIGVNKIELY